MYNWEERIIFHKKSLFLSWFGEVDAGEPFRLSLLFTWNNSSNNELAGDFKLDSIRREPYISSDYTLYILMEFHLIYEKERCTPNDERDLTQ